MALAAVVCLLHGAVVAQDIQKFDEITVTYWRAFHGTIESRISRDEQGAYTAFASLKDQESGADLRHVGPGAFDRKKISRLREFVNDQSVRLAFTKSQPVVQPDGELLEVRVRQGSFSLLFSSQVPSGARHGTVAKRFQSIAFDLLKETGIPIEKDERWVHAIVAEAVINQKAEGYDGWKFTLKMASERPYALNFSGNQVSVAEVLFLIAVDIGVPWDQLFELVAKP